MKRGDFVFRAEDFCKQLLIIIFVNGDQQLKIWSQIAISIIIN